MVDRISETSLETIDVVGGSSSSIFLSERATVENFPFDALPRKYVTLAVEDVNNVLPNYTSDREYVLLVGNTSNHEEHAEIIARNLGLSVSEAYVFPVVDAGRANCFGNKLIVSDMSAALLCRDGVLMRKKSEDEIVSMHEITLGEIRGLYPSRDISGKVKMK